MRKNEIDKIDYNFINRQEFEYMIDNNQFIDYKIRNNNYYGISRNSIDESSIITLGNFDAIAKETGYNIYKIYLDTNLITRYMRMMKRNPENKNDILSILEYEEYILRKLSFIKDSNKKLYYYKLMKNYLNSLNVEYNEELDKTFELNLNNKIYKLDYRENRI